MKKSEKSRAEKSFAKRIRDIRIGKRFTQAEFAEILDLSAIYYQSIEAGRRSNLPLRTIDKIASKLGLKVMDLFRKRKPAISKKLRCPSRPHRKK